MVGSAHPMREVSKQGMASLRRAWICWSRLILILVLSINKNYKEFRAAARKLTPPLRENKILVQLCLQAHPHSNRPKPQKNQFFIIFRSTSYPPSKNIFTSILSHPPTKPTSKSPPNFGVPLSIPTPSINDCFMQCLGWRAGWEGWGRKGESKAGLKPSRKSSACFIRFWSSSDLRRSWKPKRPSGIS